MDHSQTIALYQPLLQSIAYQLLKRKEEAEDMVQETFLKWLSVDHSKIENTKAYLVTVVTNQCLNHLKTLRTKKEEYWDSLQLLDKFGKFWETTDLSTFDMSAEMAAALKVVQRKLEPMERAVFLLKEVFDYDYETLQEVLDKKSENCRQLFSRAKKKLNQETGRFKFEMPTTASFYDSFRKACEAGSVADLLADLRNDINKAMQK